jgi:hypothetical protein
MRVGAGRLPVLIAVAALIAATAAPAGAADEGEVGIVDNSVEVIAASSVPGAAEVADGGGQECVLEEVIADDLASGVYELDGERMYSDTGRWLRLICEDGLAVEVGGLRIFPEGGGFTIPDLLEQARRSLDPAEPSWRASPDGIEVPMVVQMPTWLWISPGYWNGTFAARASTPSGRVWAEATAVPTTATWLPGDDETVVCVGGGTPWDDGVDAEPTCSHTYRHSTAGGTERLVSVTVEFAVSGSTSIDPTPIDFGTITRTSAPVSVEIGEIQALETNGAT